MLYTKKSSLTICVLLLYITADTNIRSKNFWIYYPVSPQKKYKPLPKRETNFGTVYPY